MFLLRISVQDQVGGAFLNIPEPEVHIPRFNGAFFTLPAGLAIPGGRNFIWTLVPPIPPGVLGITGTTTETPTIEFDELVFSGENVRIKCQLLGQLNNFIVYTLDTVLTSRSKVGVHRVSFFSDYGYQFNNFNMTVTGAENAGSLANFPSNYQLSWNANTTRGISGRIIERWDPVANNWVLENQSNDIITVTHFSTNNVTHRIIPVLNQYTYGNPVYTYTQLEQDDTYALTPFLLSLYFRPVGGFIRQVDQTPTNRGFFLTTEFENFEDKDPLTVYLKSETFNVDQSPTSASFFVEILLENQEDKAPGLDVYFKGLSTISVDQTPSTEIFWVEQTGG